MFSQLTMCQKRLMTVRVIHTEAAIRLNMQGKQGELMFVDLDTESKRPGQHYDVVEGEYTGQDLQGKPLNFTYRMHVFMNQALPHDTVVNSIQSFVNQHGSNF